ncbi:MAG: SGNH/GDSL hydrolase family protein [Candidatus Heimdallarchaeota archaeon]|nr:SGNH/GDSL hydrolase family protein [Candidatus Heimdallarchaeota archaeon]
MARKFLALGDSYTIGESVSIEDRWPVQLQNILKQTGIDIDELKIVAVTGWTTSELQLGISNDLFAPPYDLVSLLIGVNNQYRNEDKNKYRSELTELIYQAIDFTGGDIEKVFVVSIPDWSTVPFAEGRDRNLIADEIDIFNKIKLEQCEKIGVKFIDITPISKTASNDPELTAEDGLHPSGKMYQLWMSEIVPVVRQMLLP